MVTFVYRIELVAYFFFCVSDGKIVKMHVGKVISLLFCPNTYSEYLDNDA